MRWWIKSRYWIFLSAVCHCEIPLEVWFHIGYEFFIYFRVHEW